MTARRTPPLQKPPFFPAGEKSTYQDLLLFENRLKGNAANLRKRKTRYQLVLAQLILIITFLSSEVFLETQYMVVPYKAVLREAFPETYSDDIPVQLHPYIAKGLLLVSITTLALFFASGLYSEKIGYADSYVHHANRALRSFNMYLNVRHHPLRSRIFVNPFSTLFSSGAKEGLNVSSRTSSSDRRPKRGASVPIPPIPPSSNPRGELIFSSRVDRNFRESYERYRAAFERKREEVQHLEAAKTWRGWRIWPWNWMHRRPITISQNRSHSPSRPSPLRGRASDTESAATTPGSSRRSSPAPRSRGGSKGSVAASAIPSRLSTPDSRARVESFSLLLSGEQAFA